MRSYKFFFFFFGTTPLKSCVHIPVWTGHIANAQWPHVTDGEHAGQLRARQFLKVLSVLKTLLLPYCQN